MVSAAERWLEFKNEVTAECLSLSRDPDHVKLIVVTKFHDSGLVRELWDAGARDFGESRHQEASQKVAELTDCPATWHFVGQIQSNKAKAIARYSSVLHSLDRDSVIDALSNSEHPVSGFIEFNLTEDPGRGGVNDESEMLRIADKISRTNNIKLLGVMTVAPQNADPSAAFARLHKISERLVESHPDAKYISAGMSQDWRQALSHGATHLRVGTAITGNRL